MNRSHLYVLLVLAVWLFVGGEHAAHLLLAGPARHLIALSALAARGLAVLIEGHGHGRGLSAC